MNLDCIPKMEQEPYEYANKFIRENETLFSNSLLQSFISIHEHKRLLDQFVRLPNPKTKEAVDHAFQRHYAEIRLIGMLSNNLKRCAVRYDQRRSRDYRQQLLILDQPVVNDEGTVTTNVDLMKDPQTIPVDQEVIEKESHLENKIENPGLYHAIHSLTPRQKAILESAYLFEMTDTEIAKRDQVSQQSISKARKQALQKMKNQLLEGK
ncbi:sigma-70 family RNA polymerase sigma factor [Virgibacillus ihumii]|uniref:sigma-70 family RNA polymerase sigma factor n=1 Tax=Virgibacillus ihumii TaxID=2686091 RepID=UPI00157C5107|nr:sigma-70 family RNA polymerase sigma factor [Virgibacillus ihumii]